jgi:hypothetical protein
VRCGLHDRMRAELHEQHNGGTRSLHLMYHLYERLYLGLHQVLHVKLYRRLHSELYKLVHWRLYKQLYRKLYQVVYWGLLHQLHEEYKVGIG